MNLCCKNKCLFCIETNILFKDWKEKLVSVSIQVRCKFYEDSHNFLSNKFQNSV